MTRSRSLHVRVQIEDTHFFLVHFAALAVRLAGDVIHQVSEWTLAGAFRANTGLADLA